MTSAAISFASIPKVIKYCNSHRLYDFYDKRKIHTKDTPRLGGIVFLPSIALSMLLLSTVCNLPELAKPYTSRFMNISAGALIIFLTGIYDDIKGISPIQKLTMQIIAASLLPLSGFYIRLNMPGIYGTAEFGMLLTAFAIIYINNAMNFIDGIDGLCGCVAVMAAMACTCCFISLGMTLQSMITSGTAGAVCAFLYYNMSDRKKIFMGDTGSLTLGFILSAAIIEICSSGIGRTIHSTYSGVAALTIMFIPAADLFRVAFYRIIHKRNIMAADKSHIHHKIMEAGLSPHKCLIAITAGISVLIAINIFLLDYISLTIMFLTDAVLFTVINGIINTVIKHGRE